KSFEFGGKRMDVEYMTDFEIQQEVLAFYNSQARLLVDNYLEQYPDHDISDHVGFTLVGISSFLMTWHSDKERIKMTPELCDRIIKMFMCIIPRDWHLLENLESELIRMSSH